MHIREQQEYDRPQGSVILGAQEAIKEAGEILLSYYQKSLLYQYKADGSYATQADHASERYLMSVLHNLVPGAAFYAEESGITSGNEYAWVIDPLDGTANFAHGMPYFCVTIALTRHMKPLLALTYQPLTKELFFAEKDRGAFLNGERIKISSVTQLERAYMSAHSCSGGEWFTHTYTQLIIHGVSMRNFGAGALDIAYCAAGRLDGCFFKGTHWWDVAAGLLLVEEAGGIVKNLYGGGVSPEDSSFIGGNELIVNQLNQFLQTSKEV